MTGSVGSKFDDRSVLIWGYGREGKSTEQFLKRCTKAKRIEIFEGKWEDIREEDYDWIFKSPGIVMEEENPKVTSQTDVFLEAFADRVIGITGTKGKSTTAAMLYHVLRECIGPGVIFLGNIGEPCLNHYEEVGEDTVVVFEMSCHQLAHAKVSPHIAVFLNLYEEHLDYYGTFEKYFRAKCNITTHQTPEDVLYIGEGVENVETRAKRITVSRKDCPDFGLSILGAHNDYNAEFVFRIATEQYGADPGRVRESLKSFQGLPHRLQFVGKKDGIAYYDDSISTIPEAAIEALQAVPHAKTVLIGGMDRGIDYDLLVSFIREHPEFTYLFMYDSGRRIFEQVADLPCCEYAGDLEGAVEKAREVTPQGFACVLSPAAASYGTFKNFEERGDRFAALAMGTDVRSGRE
ncbi:MAG: UDP-N-acetylmuramoyl-L-alanine--D-glutamate ligase [Lachnospiraceae bacterium]|nr:UDP-N-acetylmuramoyl-L-alanine--D-glutamate ligase [Lachnospiraceae bacterium]